MPRFDTLRSLDRNRTQLGILTVLLAAAGAWLWAAGQRTNGGVALRVAAVMAALWFAWPSLRRITPRTVVLGVVATALALYRPATLWLVLPLLIVGSRWLRPRQARS